MFGRYVSVNTRIFSELKAKAWQDGTFTDVLMAAFTLAYEDGVDIITASIGGPGGFSSDRCDKFMELFL